MDKPNVFKSNNFHMDANDVLHILIKDLTGDGVVIALNDGEGSEEDSENVGFTTTLEPTTTAAPTTSEPIRVILTGTYNTGYVLKSTDDGLVFSNEGSLGFGAIRGFFQMTIGDILYWSGRVVNYTQNTSAVIGSSVYDIIEYDGYLYFSDPLDQKIYKSPINDIYNTSEVGSYPFSVYQLTESNGNIYVNNSNDGLYDITDSITPVVAGEFTAILNMQDGTIYVSSTDGHIWRSINHGVDWSDLGELLPGDYALRFRILNNNRIGMVSNATRYMLYTDDNFATVNTSSEEVFSALGGNVNDIIQVNDDIIVAGSAGGYIARSVDNGDTWDEIVGNPQQGESQVRTFITYTE